MTSRDTTTSTIQIPGIAEMYAKRIAELEDSESTPVQLWLPCVTGGPDTTPAPAKRRTR